jgi:DNA (cytosine-5)-methyltransferase 1
MTFLDIFAGIGGFSLGLEWAGMTCIGQIENNDFCCKVLEKHWPNVKRTKDVFETKGDEFEKPDIICGGFPCQPFSSAGTQSVKADDRYLWPEMFRLIHKIQPRWVIAENVPGILTAQDGVGYYTAIADLESAGYKVTSFSLPACAVGAMHQRHRIFFIAYSNCIGIYRLGPKYRSNKCVYTTSSKQNDLLHFKERFCTKRMFGNVRNVNGISDELDKRIAAVGNAVVPQLVQQIGYSILYAEGLL